MNSKLYSRIKHRIHHPGEINIQKYTTKFKEEVCILKMEEVEISWFNTDFNILFCNKSIIKYLSSWQYWMLRIKCSLLWNKIYNHHQEVEQEKLWKSHNEKNS